MTRERRFTWLMCALFVLEGALNTIIAPLLPHFADTLDEGPGAIAVLASSHGVGAILGTLAAASASRHPRIGVRRTTVTGLLLLAGSCAAFAVAHSVVWLDVLRFLHGVAAATLWVAPLTWLIGAIPSERRGAVLGTALASGIVGTIVGPALGALALALGVAPLFGALAVVGLALVVPVLRAPAPVHDERRERVGAARRGLRAPALAAGVWIVMLASMATSGVQLLVALRLDDLGASKLLVGATFVAAAALAAIVTPLTGRTADRRGPTVPLMTSLGAAAALLVVMPQPGSAALLAVAFVVCNGSALPSITPSGSLLIARGAERAGLWTASVAMLISMSWAAGSIVGPMATARLLDATSFVVPCVLLAALALSTLLALVARPGGRARRERA